MHYDFIDKQNYRSKTTKHRLDLPIVPNNELNYFTFLWQANWCSPYMPWLPKIVVLRASAIPHHTTVRNNFCVWKHTELLWKPRMAEPLPAKIKRRNPKNTAHGATILFKCCSPLSVWKANPNTQQDIMYLLNNTLRWYSVWFFPWTAFYWKTASKFTQKTIKSFFSQYLVAKVAIICFSLWTDFPMVP